MEIHETWHSREHSEFVHRGYTKEHLAPEEVRCSPGRTWDLHAEWAAGVVPSHHRWSNLVPRGAVSDVRLNHPECKPFQCLLHSPSATRVPGCLMLRTNRIQSHVFACRSALTATWRRAEVDCHGRSPLWYAVHAGRGRAWLI